MGCAAIFAVQLDDQLGGVPVQYRQVQDHESSLFFASFPGGNYPSTRGLKLIAYGRWY